MTTRPKLNPWDVVWFSVMLGVLFLFALSSRTPYFKVVLVVLSSVIILLSIADWRSKGHAWLPTLSWALPFGGFWIVSTWVIDRPWLLIVLVYWLGAALVLTMLISARAASWWYRVVFRRPPKL